MGTAKVSRIDVEVIGSALASIAEEMGKVLIRSAYSDNIKVRYDCSTALFDASGRVINQAEQIPLHLGSLLGMIEHIYKVHDIASIADGDVFVGNDAYVGSSTHLQDIVLAQPVFVDGELTAWAVNIAHHTDWIGRTHNEIFEEGLRIPPVRLYREGRLQDDIMQFILLNCKLPEYRRGDFRAQMAANHLGLTRFVQLCAKYGRSLVLDAIEEVLNHTEAMTRHAIERVPDGVYTYESKIDTDLLDDDLDVRVSVEVRGSDILFDFTGNPQQVKAGINAILNATRAVVYFAVKTLIDSDIPANDGFYRPIVVTATPGSIYNAQEPAAVYARQDVVKRVICMIHGALSKAVPDRVQAACTGGVIMTMSGINPRTGRYFVHNETIGGGHGGRAHLDGLDACQSNTSNSANIPVEVLETEYPLFVEEYALVPDSGGHGTYRGGMSIKRSIRVLDFDCTVWVGGTYQRHPPFGILGGGAGLAVRTEVSEGAAPLVRRVSTLRSDESVTVYTTGGGGFGDPAKRPRHLVERDLREGKISEETARDVYGFEPAG